jgi:hypothetical protein
MNASDTTELPVNARDSELDRFDLSAVFEASKICAR